MFLMKRMTIEFLCLYSKSVISCIAVFESEYDEYITNEERYVEIFQASEYEIYCNDFGRGN